jgi:hypothetical protein
MILDKESLYYIINQNLYKFNPYVNPYLSYLIIDEVSPNRIKITKNFNFNKDGIISNKLKLRIKRN